MKKSVRGSTPVSLPGRLFSIELILSLLSLALQSTAFQRREPVFSGEGRLPGGDEVFPSGDEALPAGERAIPSGERGLPNGETALPAQNRTIPSKKGTVPTQNRTIPSGNRTVPSPSRTATGTRLALEVRRDPAVFEAVTPGRCCAATGWRGPSCAVSRKEEIP